MSDAGLPPSDFQDPLNLSRRESQMLAGWAERGIWARLRQQNAGAEPFVLAGGPVDARPFLPVDTAFHRILQDIVAKFRHLSGCRCDVLPGWSVHGQALEQECLGLQEAELQRLGVFGRAEASYRTRDASSAERELRERAALARRGELTRLLKPSFWCPRDQRVLAEEEVEDAPRQSPSLYMAFRAGPELAERLPMLAGQEVFFLVWTSAPWRLPAHQTLSVNGDFEYVFYQLGERVVCAARPLLAKVLAEVKGDELVKKTAHLRGGDVETVGFENPRRILAYASGEDLEHLTYQHPWLERTGRVVLSPHVTDEAGTGLVLTAPAQGGEWVEFSRAVREDGRYDGSVGEALQGQNVFEADPLIVELLEARGVLLNEKRDRVEHRVPHCRSCHQPVLLLALDQWFIPLEVFQDNVLSVEEVRQQYGADVFRLWVADRFFRPEARLREDALAAVSQELAKVRNTLHSALSHLDGFDPERDAVPVEALPLQEARLRGPLAEVVEKVRQAYENGEFHRIVPRVRDFCADVLSAEVLGRLTQDTARRSAQTVLYEEVSTLARLLAPLLSFTAEEVWQSLPGKKAESVFLAGFPGGKFVQTSSNE
ncbi:class I tRNA ligase family protein [Stigmatella sp. ncwal1]|uniref:isoleucine--tRNA ligase n=1 Tax=Stigmatella ashevillensis TaxID=2995309 RepID=A0ABT5DCS0_9BACT|nr:class I tRNA ligase family protein [Stigmatella ashevillena]MDC0711457.1 class I tRNA ligase family protein [Stigmatella ashevillena]